MVFVSGFLKTALDGLSLSGSDVCAGRLLFIDFEAIMHENKLHRLEKRKTRSEIKAIQKLGEEPKTMLRAVVSLSFGSVRPIKKPVPVLKHELAIHTVRG